MSDTTIVGDGVLYDAASRPLGAVEYIINLKLPVAPSLMRTVSGRIVVDLTGEPRHALVQTVTSLRLEDGIHWWDCQLRQDGRLLPHGDKSTFYQRVHGKKVYDEHGNF